MRYRIGGWAIVGFLIAGVWALYFARTTKDYGTGPIVSFLLGLTCPIALFSHHSIGLFSVLAANTATYALAGLLVEVFRRQRSHSHA